MKKMTSMGGRDGDFPRTRMSRIDAARGGAGETRRRAALEELAQAYWRPLYVFQYLLGRDNEDAKDLVQGFFATLAERNVLPRFDPAAGRFRTYLLACFKNFSRDARDRREAVRRGGGKAAVPLAPELLEQARAFQAAALTPEEAYERRWAREKLVHACARLRQELGDQGDPTARKVLDGYLGADNPARPNYAGLSAVSGLTRTEVRHLLERLRRRLREALLEELRMESGTESAAQEELGSLMACLERGS